MGLGGGVITAGLSRTAGISFKRNNKVTLIPELYQGRKGTSPLWRSFEAFYHRIYPQVDWLFANRSYTYSLMRGKSTPSSPIVAHTSSLQIKSGDCIVPVFITHHLWLLQTKENSTLRLSHIPFVDGIRVRSRNLFIFP